MFSKLSAEMVAKVTHGTLYSIMKLLILLNVSVTFENKEK